jgi:hypothetical protein
MVLADVIFDGGDELVIGLAADRRSTLAIHLLGNMAPFSVGRSVE